MGKSVNFAWTFLLLMAAGAAAQTAVTTSGGTTNAIPMFTGSATVGNSPITVSGSNVGIGTTAPNASLEVLGSLVVDGEDNSLTSTQVNGGNWGWNGLVVGSTNPVKYSGIAVGGALRSQSGPYNGLVSFHNFGVNLSLSQTMGAQIGAIPDDTVATDIGMSLRFMTLQSGVNSLTERMRILSSGNVGIGTTAPAYTFDVNGKIHSSSGVVYQDGTTQTTAWTGVLCGGDYAEAVNAAGGKKSYEPGDVLVLASGSDSDVAKSSEPYSTLVAGIYATLTTETNSN